MHCLRNTKVTDKGLQELQLLKNLEILPPHQNLWVNSGSGKAASR